LAKAVAAAGLTLALLAPASAQFWGGWGDGGGWGGRPRWQQQQQQFIPFGGWLDNNPREIRPPREAPADYSRAPAPQRKPDSAATTPVVVLGDAMADWLAY